jgi:hypothetical protein
MEQGGAAMPGEARPGRDTQGGPAAPPRRVAVARVVDRPPPVRTAPEHAAEAPLLTAAAIRGLGVSLAFHALVLLALGLWFFRVPAQSARVIEASLAGSLFGSELGDDFEGGLGMETPLAMPKGPGTALDSTTLTILPPMAEPTLDPSVAAAAPAAAANGGGLSLTNPGQGGATDGFGVARFGTGTERVKGVDVKIGDPQLTLIWEGQGDLDLHVIEPGGSHIYWPLESRQGEQGGELDVDKRDGPGPENIYWQGRGPDGAYKWFVEYYGPAPLERYAGPIRWRVRIKHKDQLTVFNGVLKQIGDRSKTYTLNVGRAD